MQRDFHSFSDKRIVNVMKVCMYGVSRRYDGSRPQSVLVLACVRLWLCRPIRDAQSRPQT